MNCFKNCFYNEARPKYGAGTRYSQYFGATGVSEDLFVKITSPLVIGRYRPPKNGRRPEHQTKKTGKVKTPRPAPLGAIPGFDTFVRFPWIGSQNRPVTLPLNKAKSPWCQLGHTILVFKSGSHFRVQYWTQSCI